MKFLKSPSLLSLCPFLQLVASSCVFAAGAAVSAATAIPVHPAAFASLFLLCASLFASVAVVVRLVCLQSHLLLPVAASSLIATALSILVFVECRYCIFLYVLFWSLFHSGPVLQSSCVGSGCVCCAHRGFCSFLSKLQCFSLQQNSAVAAFEIEKITRFCVDAFFQELVHDEVVKLLSVFCTDMHDQLFHPDSRRTCGSPRTLLCWPK